MEGVRARGTALKLFAQLLGGSRPGGAVVRPGSPDQSAAGERESTGRKEPPPEQGEAEGEEAAEAERGPLRALGSQGPGPWTGEAAECADSAPAACTPQAPARASAPSGSGARRGARESGPPRSPSRRASTRRAGPGRASDTMNFLLSWVHWSLALLLYLHHAKVSGCARRALSWLGACEPASERARAWRLRAPRWSVAPGAVSPAVPERVGEGTRAGWEGAGVPPPTRALPTHRSHRTYYHSRPARAGAGEAARGLGWRGPGG